MERLLLMARPGLFLLNWLRARKHQASFTHVFLVHDNGAKVWTFVVYVFKNSLLPSVLIYTIFSEHHNADGGVWVCEFQFPKPATSQAVTGGSEKFIRTEITEGWGKVRSAHTLSPLSSLAGSITQAMRAVEKVLLWKF